MKNYRSAFLLAAVFSVSGVSKVTAATATANPVADAFVTTGPANDLSNNNYGAAGALSIAAPGSAKGEFQSVMRFDLAAAKTAFDGLFGASQWQVQSLTLQLSAQSAANPIFNAASAGQFSIGWMQNDSWVEGSGSPGIPSGTGITYTSLVNTFISGSDQNIGTFSYSGATSGTFTYSLTLSSGMLDDIQNGSLLSLRLFASDASMSGVFPSRSFGTPANRPLLTIDAIAVPEPSSLALVGTTAALAMVCFSRCRHVRGN